MNTQFTFLTQTWTCGWFSGASCEPSYFVLAGQLTASCLLWHRGRKGTGVQHVASALYRGSEVNCVSGACSAWNAADLRRMKVEAHRGERGKSSRQGEAGLLLRSPCSLFFYASARLSLPSFCFFALLRCCRASEGEILLLCDLREKPEHHGAALPRNGNQHTSSSRSEPPVRWQSPTELVDDRREVFTPVFLFQRRPERHSAVHEENGRHLDVGGT